MFGFKRRTVRSCRLSSTFRARRAIRPILCTSEICCSRYESQAQAESPLSTSFWKRSELKCGLWNQSGGACRSATADLSVEARERCCHSVARPGRRNRANLVRLKNHYRRLTNRIARRLIEVIAHRRSGADHPTSQFTSFTLRIPKSAFLHLLP